MLDFALPRVSLHVLHLIEMKYVHVCECKGVV